MELASKMFLGELRPATVHVDFSVSVIFIVPMKVPLRASDSNVGPYITEFRHI